MPVVDKTVEHLTAHIAGQAHAMAGSTAAITSALACSLGEACVRISASYLEAAADKAETGPAAERLAAIRVRLQQLADEDSELIALYAAENDAGEEPKGKDRLCSLPVEVGMLSGEAASRLQDFRLLVRHVPDDLEIAIGLLKAGMSAAAKVLDSNLHIWPSDELVGKYEPQLEQLRDDLASLNPVERFR